MSSPSALGRLFCALVPAAVLASMFALSGCNDIRITFDDGESKVKGSGVAASETRAMASFEAIEATGVGKLKVRIADNESVRVSADDNILPLIKTEVRNGVLVLSTKGATQSKTDIIYK